MADFGVVPRPALTRVLLRMPAVQRELKLTDAQKNETEAAQLANLRPEQRERLAQIQIQAQGPLAFSLGDRNRGRFIDPRLQ